MSAKFFEELIGKECEIALRDDECETGTLLEVDGEWLKLHDDYGKTVYINARQVISLSVEEKKEERGLRWDRRRR